MLFLFFVTVLFNISYQYDSGIYDVLTKCQIIDRQLPDALIIGVKKSGTYALIRYLNANPNIKTALKANGCKLNEIHYFDSDLNYSFGLNWYKNQMPVLCKQNKNDKFIVIEKTPGYFRKEKTIDRIKNYKSDVKLILIVRDPIKRLQSELTHCDHRQKRDRIERNCINMNNFLEEIFKRKDLNDTILENNKFIRNSLYYLDLKNWMKKFKINESLLIIDGDSFIQRPWDELNKIELFLGLDKVIKKEDFNFNDDKKFYCLNKIGCLGKNKGRKEHVYLSEFVKENLKKFYSKWNLLFYDLIGQEFNW